MLRKVNVIIFGLLFDSEKWNIIRNVGGEAINDTTWSLHFVTLFPQIRPQVDVFALKIDWIFIFSQDPIYDYSQTKD